MSSLLTFRNKGYYPPVGLGDNRVGVYCAPLEPGVYLHSTGFVFRCDYTEFMRKKLVVPKDWYEAVLEPALHAWLGKRGMPTMPFVHMEQRHFDIESTTKRKYAAETPEKRLRFLLTKVTDRTALEITAHWLTGLTFEDIDIRLKDFVWSGWPCYSRLHIIARYNDRAWRMIPVPGWLLPLWARAWYFTGGLAANPNCQVVWHTEAVWAKDGPWYSSASVDAPVEGLWEKRRFDSHRFEPAPVQPGRDTKFHTVGMSRATIEAYQTEVVVAGRVVHLLHDNGWREFCYAASDLPDTHAPPGKYEDAVLPGIVSAGGTFYQWMNDLSAQASRATQVTQSWIAEPEHLEGRTLEEPWQEE